MSPRRVAARRALLVLAAGLFVIGRLWAAWDRASPPDETSFSLHWPEPPARLLDATAVGRQVEVYPPGTTVFVALGSLGLSPELSLMDGELPRACVLLRKENGWAIATMTQSERWCWGIPMELHRCRAEDFTRLPGVGPVLARHLEEFLRSNPGIRSVEELERAAGIGRARVQAISKFLELGTDNP